MSHMQCHDGGRGEGEGEGGGGGRGEGGIGGGWGELVTAMGVISTKLLPLLRPLGLQRSRTYLALECSDFLQLEMFRRL
jgi:hypothetical protein